MNWEDYLQNWLDSLLPLWSARSIRFTGPVTIIAGVSRPGANEISVPLRFAQETLGELHIDCVETPSDLSPFERAASELAAFLRFPKRELAMILDSKVAQIKAENPNYDWCGIYSVENGELYVSVYRGAPTPHAIIPLSHGICGAAVTENQTLNIPDVSQDSRYLSCDFRTKSEVVIPIRDEKGNAIAELDIDSHKVNAFPPADVAKLEEVCRELSRAMLKYR